MHPPLMAPSSVRCYCEICNEEIYFLVPLYLQIWYPRDEIRNGLLGSYASVAGYQLPLPSNEAHMIIN
jgi:hypothetical protein